MEEQTLHKILVVDDNQDNRELIVKIMTHQGYHVVEAIDGKDALEKADSKGPGLILMDISIPNIDGYEVTRRLKREERFKHTPIIALTAHAMKGDRDKALEAGCDGYISKPIDIKQFPEQVRSFLKSKA